MVLEDDPVPAREVHRYGEALRTGLLNPGMEAVRLRMQHGEDPETAASEGRAIIHRARREKRSHELLMHMVQRKRMRISSETDSDSALQSQSHSPLTLEDGDSDIEMDSASSESQHETLTVIPAPRATSSSNSTSNSTSIQLTPEMRIRIAQNRQAAIARREARTAPAFPMYFANPAFRLAPAEPSDDSD